MDKINFKNLPDTTTPLSAENLNLLQDNVEDAIDNVSIDLDSQVSTTSTNGVENQAITNYVNDTFVESSDLADVATTGDYDDLINKPTVLSSTILYNNSEGTASTITLSDNVNNYDYIEVYFKTNDTGSISSRKIYNLWNGSNIADLDYGHDDGTLYYKSANVSVNGTTITFLSNSQYVNFSSRSTGSFIYITRVIGYK